MAMGRDPELEVQMVGSAAAGVTPGVSVVQRTPGLYQIVTVRQENQDHSFVRLSTTCSSICRCRRAEHGSSHASHGSLSASSLLALCKWPFSAVAPNH